MKLKSCLFILWRDETNDKLTIPDTMQSSTNHLLIHLPVFYLADPGPVAGPGDRKTCAVLGEVLYLGWGEAQRKHGGRHVFVLRTIPDWNRNARTAMVLLLEHLEYKSSFRLLVSQTLDPLARGEATAYM